MEISLPHWSFSNDSSEILIGLRSRSFSFFIQNLQIVRQLLQIQVVSDVFRIAFLLLLKFKRIINYLL